MHTKLAAANCMCSVMKLQCRHALRALQSDWRFTMRASAPGTAAPPATGTSTGSPRLTGSTPVLRRAAPVRQPRQEAVQAQRAGKAANPWADIARSGRSRRNIVLAVVQRSGRGGVIVERCNAQADSSSATASTPSSKRCRTRRSGCIGERSRARPAFHLVISPPLNCRLLSQG